MNSIEPKITISKKIEGNNLIMASSSTWSGNSNFLMKSQNSSKGVSKKKMSFIPQPTTSTALPNIDLISFDQWMDWIEGLWKEDTEENEKENDTTYKSRSKTMISRVMW